MQRQEDGETLCPRAAAVFVFLPVSMNVSVSISSQHSVNTIDYDIDIYIQIQILTMIILISSAVEQSSIASFLWERKLLTEPSFSSSPFFSSVFVSLSVGSNGY